jgi:phage tail sheath protein FI
MPEYLSPGVYVEEVPSAIKPIAGVSTSTAGFVGVVTYPVKIPEINPDYDPTGKSQDPSAKNPFRTWTFPLPDDEFNAAQAAFDALAEPGRRPPQPRGLKDEADPKKKSDLLRKFRDAQDALTLATHRRTSGISKDELANELETPVLCTTFGDFTKHFGGFSADPGQNKLAQGVYGFFNNGGTRCYVMRFNELPGLQDPLSLAPFDAIDEISIIAAPGINDLVVQSNILDHCENLADRFAILDPPDIPEDGSVDLTEGNIKVPRNTDYGALYFPKIKVFSTAAKLTGTDLSDKPQPCADGEIYVAPSGHIAGIYSRTDHERGVHKAPANEVIRGALDVEFQISRNLQDGLNPGGVNCIRYMNGDIRVWGARTIGGDFNADLKYINVRRTLIFLRKSIDQGTQWVVFEPNDRTLWQKIVRNVSAFLTTVWRDGALFGSTPQEAFYVRCDDETNPFEERDLGRVTTEIGVAIVRPAEFVIFRIEQWAGPQAQ